MKLLSSLVATLTFCTLSLAAPLSAMAQEKCSNPLVKGNAEAKILTGTPRASCATTDTETTCTILYSAKVHKGQPISDFLYINRSSTAKKWTIYLQTPAPIDDVRRLSITVDQNDPMEIPMEFLNHGPSKIKLRTYIDLRLTQTVIDEIKKGQKAVLTLTYHKDGKDQTFTDHFDTDSFKNTAAAFKWVSCMVGK